MNIRTDILLRVYISFGIMVVIALAVVYKMFNIQMVHGEKWAAMADSLSTRYVDIDAARGNIYSVDGSLLATSVPEYDIRMDMYAPGIEEDDVFYSKVDSLAHSLSGFFKDKSATQYSRALRRARSDKNRYFLIKRDVSYQSMKKMRSFPIFNLGIMAGGMIAEQKNKRVLPFDDLAKRTIGYKNENVQPVGLEGAYANYIDGEGGKRLVQRIAGGVWMPVNPEMDVAPVDGADIISTIDIRMQDIAQSALERQLITSNADNGCVIVMEVKTGEVRAIANYTRVAEGTYEEKFNYAIAQSAEPGSTFKLASYLVALEDGKIDTGDIVDTGNGVFRVYNKTHRDSRHGGYGKISVKKAFEVSSNTAITKLIHTYYNESPAAFTRGLHELHLNDKLGLQFPGEGRPLIKTPDSKSWSGLSLTQMSYGYELLMTPLQMLTFYNAVANDGVMISPLFVKEIRRLGNTVERYKARVIDESIASPRTIKVLQEMLLGAVEEGTGKGLKNSLFKIAGKTGTAQMADGAAGYRGRRRYQASFAGYFPANNPKYSMIVVVQNPRNGYYAASVAGPVFSEVAQRIYASDMDMYQGVGGFQMAQASVSPETKAGSMEAAKRLYQEFDLGNAINNDSTLIAYNDTDAVKGKVPNLIGMGLKDALYILGNAGFKVSVNGKGKVVRQSLSAGQEITNNLSIAIELK
ncbi:penicillin-binding protein [Albibacterium indicum]|uniref:penicillin-binding protein n=1 Tax=Albibacterium indicum TaxID=2292082 RepID=UPI000E48B11B|nr:penicillin-binding protein [Pedobacter indicus]